MTFVMALRLSSGEATWCSLFHIFVIWALTAVFAADCVQSGIDDKVFNLTAATHLPVSVEWSQMLVQQADNPYDQYEDQLYTNTDTFAEVDDLLEESSELAKEQVNAKVMTIGSNYPESPEARNSFINNQYVPNKDANDIDSAARDVAKQTNVAIQSAFYTLLEQQMRQLLSNSSSRIRGNSYMNSNRADGVKLATPPDTMQGPTSINVSGSDAIAAAESSDYTEQTDYAESSDYAEKTAIDDVLDNGYKQETFTSAAPFGTPSTQRMLMAEITVPAHPYKIQTTARPPTLARPFHVGIPPSTKRPFYKKKRRIAFKTVSTATQFVSTPLAELMFKYTIGIAQPTRSVEAHKPDTVSRPVMQV